jgi:hypothetical protein
MPSRSPFYVGGNYRDRKQDYVVTDLSPGSMTVEYEDGTVQTLDAGRIEIKARIYNNIRAEYRSAHPAVRDSYFETLGFLSAHARFDAELPPRLASNFVNQYHTVTGVRISSEHPGVVVLASGADKWAPELRIYFPTPPLELDFGTEVQVRAGQGPGISRVNKNSLWWRLAALGFRLGSDHEVSQILDTIPPERHAVFERGRKR